MNVLEVEDRIITMFDTCNCKGYRMDCKTCADAIDIVREALEKQIPKKPIHGQNCRNCDSFNFRHAKYCHECGQAIDWSDEE